MESFNKFIKCKLLEIFRKSTEDFCIKEAVKSFLKEYNFARIHSGTGMIPNSLFHSGPDVWEKAAKKMINLKNKQKEVFTIKKETKLAITSSFRYLKAKNQLNFIEKKEPSKVIAIGELEFEFCEGYASVSITKWFGNFNLPDSILCDPKLCLILHEYEYAQIIHSQNNE